MGAEGPDPRFAAIHVALVNDGFAVRDGFLSAERVRGLIACAAQRLERGDFNAARIGAGGAVQRRADIRGDSICWWDEALFDAERGLLDDLDALRLHLNRESFLGLFDVELHYAWYPPGAGYARHVDQLQGRAQRLLSFIVYLNVQWVPGAGGELRIFDDGGGHTDVEPRGGRVVCFLTRGREHAVLPTQVGRWSITGWFRGRDSL